MMCSSKKVIFIVGLPGSGKSHYLKAHSDDFKDFLQIDDPSATYSKANLIALTYSNRNLVISDPRLCNPGARDYAKILFSDFQQEWVFFENDPTTCWDNIRFREDGRFISRFFLMSLSMLYVIPEGATVIPVHKAS